MTGPSRVADEAVVLGEELVVGEDQPRLVGDVVQQTSAKAVVLSTSPPGCGQPRGVVRWCTTDNESHYGEDLMNRRGMLRGGVVAVVAAGALAAVPATTAHAAGSVSCSWTAGAYGCSKSETVTPNFDNSILLGASTNHRAHPVTCRAIDASTAVEVGRITSVAPHIMETTRIYGLYGRYFLSCIGDRQSSGGGGINGY